MKKLFAILLFITSALYAQDEQAYIKPDFATIEKNIKDKTSPFFYQKLFDRYQKADTTFTLEEKYHLYYGYSFTEGYKPYFTSDNTAKIFELINTDNLSKEQMQKVITLSDELLKGYPFNLTMRGYRAYFFNELGKKKESDDEMARANMIFDAILATGDGTTKQTCFYVISVGNEYELINSLGFAFTGEQKLVDYQYDYLKLEENDFNLLGLYFDVSRVMSTIK